MKRANDRDVLVLLTACWLAWPTAPDCCAGCPHEQGIPSQAMAAFSRQDGFCVGAASAPNTGDGNSPSDQRPPPKMVGGPCEYKTYTGRAEIISVRLIALPKGHPGPPHENFEVKFIFFPDQRIDEPYAQVENKPQLLTLTNSWYPGPRFLEKYGIAERKTFDCRLKVITRGTCTPVVFTFPEVDLGDYFEGRSSEERR